MHLLPLFDLIYYLDTCEPCSYSKCETGLSLLKHQVLKQEFTVNKLHQSMETWVFSLSICNVDQIGFRLQMCTVPHPLLWLIRMHWLGILVLHPLVGWTWTVVFVHFHPLQPNCSGSNYVARYFEPAWTVRILFDAVAHCLSQLSSLSSPPQPQNCTRCSRYDPEPWLLSGLVLTVLTCIVLLL